MKTRLSLALAFLLMVVQGLWAQTPMTPAGENTWTAPMPACQILLHAEYWGEYVISYELNGGINHEENPVKYYEDQEITLKNPTKEGYVFAGWTGSNGEEPQIEVTIAMGSTENKSYTAHWTEIPVYAVEFALGDAEGTAPAALDVTIGEDITMPVNKTMYKEGYTLTGWSDGVNTYAIGNSFTPANDVVLTPVFTANEADLLNASSEVTVKWYFGGDNGAPTMLLQGATGLLVAQATIGDKTVDVKLSIDATSGKFAPQPTTEWANVQVGTIFTYPYKEGMTVNVGTYSGNVTYYVANGNVTCGKNDLYSFIEVTYPASTPGPSTAIDNANANANAVKVIRNGQLLIERDGKTYNAQGAKVR
jgi:Listeria/Bacterioides repeat